MLVTTQGLENRITYYACDNSRFKNNPTDNACDNSRSRK